MLERGIATFRCIGLAICLGDVAPGERSDIALRHALAEEEQRPQQQLRFGLALFGGFHKPRRGFSIVLRHAEAFVKQEANAGLGRGIALFRQTEPVVKRARVVAAVVGG